MTQMNFEDWEGGEDHDPPDQPETTRTEVKIRKHNVNVWNNQR